MKAGPLLLLFTATAQAAQPDPSLRNFVACPIVRDTASVPCWLAEYDGELYFLTLQTDVSAPVNPPWLGHRVLVEGRLSDKPRICGGIPLEPVRLSIIAEPDASCRQRIATTSPSRRRARPGRVAAAWLSTRCPCPRSPWR